MSEHDVAALCASARDPRALLVGVLLCDDDATIDYILGCLAEDDAEDGIEAAAELVGAHADLGEEQSTLLVRRVAELVQSTSAASASESLASLSLAPPPAETRAGASVRPLSSATAAPAAPSSKERSSGCSVDKDPQQLHSIESLQELVPHASNIVCDYALRQCNGDVAEAVELLLAEESLDGLEAKAEKAAASREAAARQQKEAERRAEKGSHRRAVERNDLVRDYTADRKSGIEANFSMPRLPYAENRKEALRGAGTRYLDGQVVATKGEKAIVVNQKADWDGGSTGKVITKGKRGKGYV